MNKKTNQILFLSLLLLFSIVIFIKPIRESMTNNSTDSDIVNKLNTMYSSEKGVGFRALERCNGYYSSDANKDECLRKEIEGPHGGDESILNASTTWLNCRMKEAHFYSDINFNNAETDVFLLLPGDQKYDCDFVQDAGFNGCGNNVPVCKGTADEVAKQYLESCCDGDNCECHNPYICNFKDQNLLIDTYNKIIENIRKPGSKYNTIPIKEPQRQAYWDQGSDYWNQQKNQKGKYGQPIAIGFLFDEAPPPEARKDDPLARVIASKTFANEFARRVKSTYTKCQESGNCSQGGLDLPVVMIHRKKDFKLEFLSQENDILTKTPGVTCNPDSVIPKCTPETAETDCQNIINQYGCKDKLVIGGCNSNNFCQFKKA